MTENFELTTITSIILLLIFVSFTPLIYLKYFKDLNNNIELYNTICNNKSNVYTNDVIIKNTYMWNISNVFFDFSKLEKYFHKKTATENTDKKEINRFFSIIDGEFNIMKIYNDYLHYSIPLFIVLWLVFLLNVYNIMLGYGNFSNISSNNKYFLYAALYAFFNVAIFTIIFSLILKKITEIYKDTNLYDYIILLKELDIIIKQKDIYKTENADIINIITKYSGADIKSIEEVSLNEKFVRELIKLKKERSSTEEGKFIKNSKNYRLTLENIDNFELYNTKNNIEKINNEIDDVTGFITAYIILIFMSIYMLSQSIKSNFTIIAFIIILIYIYIISIHVIKKKLE